MVMPYPLKDANAKSIPVISYDRLITGTDAVTYYVSFDNQQVCKIVTVKYSSLSLTF